MPPLTKENKKTLHWICPSVATVDKLDLARFMSIDLRLFKVEKSTRSSVESGHSSLQVLIKSTKLQDL